MDIKIKVGVVIARKDGKVLLIKEKLKKKPIALWNIVKGSYNGTETIFEAAKRECREEASLEVNFIHSLGLYISEELEKIRIQFNFLAQTNDMPAGIASAQEQTLRNEAIEEVRWFSKEEILKMRPEDFVSVRAYEILHDWIAGKSFPLEVFRQVGM